MTYPDYSRPSSDQPGPDDPEDRAQSLVADVDSSTFEWSDWRSDRIAAFEFWMLCVGVGLFLGVIVLTLSR